MAARKKIAAAAKNEKPAVPRVMAGLEKVHPDAKLDIDYSDPLELLVGLMLAAQARDDLVNKITETLFKAHRTAADYAATPLPALEAEVRKINFYRTKAKAIHNCCRALEQRFAGAVPSRLEDLLTLPGVGGKTANIVLGNAFGQDTIGVDTHVRRLSQRLGFTRNEDPDKIEADLMPLVPRGRRVRFCHLLQYHGRRICVAKKPKCPQCAIRALCPFPAKTKAAAG